MSDAETTQLGPRAADTSDGGQPPGGAVGELLRELAVALEADDVALLLGDEGRELAVEAVVVSGPGGTEPRISSTSRPPVEWVVGSLFDRALSGDGAAVARVRGSNGGAGMALAAPVRRDGQPVGLLYAALANGSADAPRRALRMIELFAKRAGASLVHLS